MYSICALTNTLKYTHVYIYIYIYVHTQYIRICELQMKHIWCQSACESGDGKTWKGRDWCFGGPSTWCPGQDWHPLALATSELKCCCRHPEVEGSSWKIHWKPNESLQHIF